MSLDSLGTALPSVTGLYGLGLGVALLALLAFWMLLRAGRHLRRRRYGRAVSRGIGGTVLGGLAALALLIGLNVLTYARFTAETPVAEVSFTSLGPQHYAVVLTTPDGHSQRAQLNGDDWQLDARVIKWKGVGTLLGLPPLYRLERLSGRYQNLQQAQQQTPSVVGLSHDPGLAFSATYLPMAEGATYRVTLSTTGLLARPANAAAEQAASSWK